MHLSTHFGTDTNHDKKAEQPSKRRHIKRNSGNNSIKQPGADPGEEIGAISAPKTHESNFFHHNCEQFGKQHSWYRVILPSIVLSQQRCEVYFTFLTEVNP